MNYRRTIITTHMSMQTHAHISNSIPAYPAEGSNKAQQISLGLRSRWIFIGLEIMDVLPSTFIRHIYIYIYIFDLKENTNDINQFPESSVLHDSTCKTAWPPELLPLTKKGRTMNFLQLVDQMIKAVHCFEGLTLRELDFQLFWRDVF